MQPPPKIPRIDKGKGLDGRRATKGEAIQSSDDKVDVLQPKTQAVAARTAPQPALPILRPAAGQAGFLPLCTNRVSDPAASAPRSLAPQAWGPPILPSLIPSLPTNPISPLAFPSDSLSPSCSFPTPALAPPPGSAPTAFPTTASPGCEDMIWEPSSWRESPTPMCIDPPSPPPGSAPTAFPTTASPGCEDMIWEPSSEPEVMDMDTTPPSEAVILQSFPGSTGSCWPFHSYGCMQQTGAANATESAATPALKVPYPTSTRDNVHTCEQRQSMCPPVLLVCGSILARFLLFHPWEQ